MHNRLIQTVLCLALVLLAGCAYSGAPPEERSIEYYVTASRAESPPTDATVISANDSRIRDVEVIQRVLVIASEKEGAQINVSEAVYQNVTDALEKTPLYTNERGYMSKEGLYVDYNGTVVRVSAYWVRLV